MRTGALIWVAPGPLDGDSRAIIALVSVLATTGTFAIAVKWYFGTSPGDLAFATVLAVAIGLAFGAVLRQGLLPPIIAVDHAGLHLRGPRRIMSIPWTDLHPHLGRSVQRRNLLVDYQDPTWRVKSRLMARIVLYPNQARILLLHPSAPRWKGDPEVLTMWGLPPDQVDRS